MVTIDCREFPTREINRRLREQADGSSALLQNPDGRHNLAVGLQNAIDVTLDGHGGYYIGGMNKKAKIDVSGNAGPGVGENMMSGEIRVAGNASSSAGASMHGGLLIIQGDASIRCGISLKGGDIVVGGSVGNMCGFMSQLGHIVICGDAGEGLGDSLYEGIIYVRGNINGLGADAQTEDMQDADYQKIEELLKFADFKHDPSSFKRVASAKTLYHFDAKKDQKY